MKAPNNKYPAKTPDNMVALQPYRVNLIENQDVAMGAGNYEYRYPAKRGECY
jgi:hypothetical protein